MRKIIIAAAAAAVAFTPALASAQSAREVRQGEREVARDRAEVRDAMRRGDHQEAREGRQELREDRRELREDWKDYRRSHQNVYRQGAYQAPRGHRYRQVGVGYRVQPSFYSNRYWINDHQRFRLSRPGYNQRWVRYGNDVLLINVRTGRVIAVHNRFFW